MRLWLDRIDSPVGALQIVSDGLHLRALHFGLDSASLQAHLRRQYGTVELQAAVDPAGTSSRLMEYFAGNLTAVDSISVAAAGTDFQKKVWSALREIPPGKTISYGTLAARIGAPTASRAVGAANGANPIGIVVPCHRVIGANGSLTGYGGGMETKRWLLAHEKAPSAAQLSLP